MSKGQQAALGITFSIAAGIAAQILRYYSPNALTLVVLIGVTITMAMFMWIAWHLWSLSNRDARFASVVFGAMAMYWAYLLGGLWIEESTWIVPMVESLLKGPSS